MVHTWCLKCYLGFLTYKAKWTYNHEAVTVIHMYLGGAHNVPKLDGVGPVDNRPSTE